MAGIIKIRRLSQVLLAPVVIILVVGLCVTAFIGIPRYRRDEVSTVYKGPAAEVNGVKIKDEEFTAVYLQLMRQYGYFMTEEEIKHETLNIVINRELVRQAIEERQIKASQEDIESVMKMVRQYYPTEEELEMLFLQTGVDGIRGLEKMIAEDVERQNLFAQAAEEAGIEIPDERIKERYETMELSHILIATNAEVAEKPLSEREARQQAESIYERIKNGEDFAQLAKEYSDDKETAQRGGNLGRSTIVNFQRSFDRDFMEAALQLTAGEVSPPVKTQYGYHLIKVVDLKRAEGENWEKEKENTRQGLLAEEFTSSDKMNIWLNEQKEKAGIVIMDPALRAYRLRKEEKWPEAALAYEKALADKRYRNNLQTYLSAADVYKQMENYDQAVGLLEKVPDKLQHNSEYAMAKARILHAKGAVDEAKEVLAAAEQKAGEDTGLLNQVLSVLKELELTEEADLLQGKITEIQERQNKEQEELEKLLREEQEKLEELEQQEQESGS